MIDALTLSILFIIANNCADVVALFKELTNAKKFGSVIVLIAASGGVGERTPTQAIKDMEYVTNNATTPWDFNLSADTLGSYRSKAYGQYFPIGSVAVKSANKYVISFLFNDEGKIVAIFMANNEATLLQ